MRIFRPLLQHGQQTFRTRFFFFVGIIVKSIKSKGGPENLSLTVRQRAAYFTANRVLIISLIIVTSMQLVFHELVVPYSSYNAIKSTPPSSCLKSALFVSLIPIMLLLSTTLAGLTLLPAFPTVAYAAQVEIQNSNGISWYDKSLAINQNNIPALVQRGTDLVNQGKYELAIVSLDKALKIDPTNIMALVTKGAALRDLGQYEEAIVLYDRVLAIDPTDVYAIGGKADSLYGLGQYELAVAWIDKALQVDPNDVNVLQVKETFQHAPN